MSTFNRSLSQRRRRQGLRPSLRQTRMRSRVAGAAPLMDGLDWNGLPLDRLPDDPEHLPYDEVVRKVSRRRTIILHTRTQQQPPAQLRRAQSSLGRRTRIILHVRRPESSSPQEQQLAALPKPQLSESPKPQLADWSRYRPGNSAEEMFTSLYQAAAVWNSMGTALKAMSIKKEYQLQDLLFQLPKLYTDF